MEVGCVCICAYLGRPWVFSFEVKFYPTEPSMLQEDLTRSHYVNYHCCSRFGSAISRGRHS